MKLKTLIAAAVTTVSCLTPAARAVYVDLEDPGDPSVTSLQGVIFSQTEFKTAGTGVIQPFLRVSANSGPGGEVREGYNTSDTSGNGPMDNIAGQFTHDVLVSDLGVFDGYYIFSLDANQIGDAQGGAKLTLSQFMIFTTDGPADGSFDTKEELIAEFGAADYSMRADSLLGGAIDGVNFAVQQTAGFPANNGSGQGDLLIYIPVSKFTSGTNLVLYTEYGAGTFVNNDGFEEWAYIRGGGTTSVPDGGATLVLLGSVLAGVGVARRYVKIG